MFSNYPTYLKEIADAYKHAPHNTKVKFNRMTAMVVATTLTLGTSCVTFDIAKAEGQKAEAIAVLNETPLSKEEVSVAVTDTNLSELLANTDMQTTIAEEDIKEVLSLEIANAIENLSPDNSTITIIDEKTTQIDIVVESGAAVSIVIVKDDEGHSTIQDISADINSDKTPAKKEEVIEHVAETKKQLEVSNQENYATEFKAYNEQEVLTLLGWNAEEHSKDADDVLANAIKDFLNDNTVVIDDAIMMLVPSGYELQPNEEEEQPAVDNAEPVEDVEAPAESTEETNLDENKETPTEQQANSTDTTENTEVTDQQTASTDKETKAESKEAGTSGIDNIAIPVVADESENTDTVSDANKTTAPSVEQEIVKTRSAKTLNYKNEAGSTISIRIEPLNTVDTTPTNDIDLVTQLMDTWNKTTESIGLSANQTIKDPAAGFKSNIFYDKTSELWGYRSEVLMTDGTRDITRMRIGFIDQKANNVITVSYRNDVTIPAEGENTSDNVSMTMDDFWKLFVGMPDKTNPSSDIFTAKVDELFVPVL